MPIVATRGLTFHVQRLGQGPPVVMVHGLLVGSLASWYFTAAPALAREHEVFLYDLRGHGKSARPATGYDLATMSADLLALVADYQPAPLTLVGHSYGALVALRTALDHPERVARLVLVDAPLPLSRFEALAGIEAFAQRGPEAMVAGLPIAMQAFVARGGRQARRLVEALRFLTSESTLLADLRAEPDFSDAQLGHIGCPVQLFYGDQSSCLPAGQRLLAAIPGGRLTVLPGGHYLHLDAMGPLSGHLLEACRG